MTSGVVAGDAVGGELLGDGERVEHRRQPTTRPARARPAPAARSIWADFEAKAHGRNGRFVAERPVNTGPTPLTDRPLSDAARRTLSSTSLSDQDDGHDEHDRRASGNTFRRLAVIGAAVFGLGVPACAVGADRVGDRATGVARADPLLRRGRRRQRTRRRRSSRGRRRMTTMTTAQHPSFVASGAIPSCPCRSPARRRRDRRGVPLLRRRGSAAALADVARRTERRCGAGRQAHDKSPGPDRRRLVGLDFIHPASRC